MSYAILDRILQKLKDLGMSPRDASISSGHSADLIRNWQRARREGRPFPGKAHMLASLAPVLGVTPEWLMQGDLREMAEDAEPFAMPEDICTPAMLSRIAPGARHLQTFVSSTSAAIIGGALLLAIKQMASAQLDTADSTLKSAQLLEKMLRTLDTMKPRPEQAQAQAQGAPAGDRNRVIKTYRGKAICREAVGVSVDETPFGNVLAAEKWIDQQARANP